MLAQASISSSPGFFDAGQRSHLESLMMIAVIIKNCGKRWNSSSAQSSNCAPKAGLHEFWCDGLDFVVWSRAEHSCFFGGACIYSDRHCNSEWLAPFELRIEYDEQDFDCPSSVDLRLGHADQSDQISKRYPSGRRYRLYAMAHCLYGSRPDSLSDWAIHVNLSPFRIG